MEKLKNIMKYAGAFIAWVIGSGFATGQEILQFFGSYGYWSFAVVGINLLGFLLIGKVMLTKGYEHRALADFNHYEYYCGKWVGKVYAVVIPITLVLLIAVLISASGATLAQYYGVNRYLGAAMMAALVLVAYLSGFEKMIKLVSSIGPVIIVFSIFVGLYTVLRDFRSISDIQNHTAVLATYRAAPHWAISAVLYLSLNFLCGGTYYSALGASAQSYQTAKWGAIVGAVILVLTIAVMNLAIVLNAGEAGVLSVPTLYLATKISDVFGAIFTLVLMLGMFASCVTAVWSFCIGFFKTDRRKNRLFSVGTMAVCLGLGFFPFGKLMAVVYPMIGYIGLFFIACVIAKGWRKNKIASKSGSEDRT